MCFAGYEIDKCRETSLDVISRLLPEVLRPAAESTLWEWIVSTRVNKTGEGDDDPTVVEPLASAA